ncbi:MAG: hypothetical protein ACR2JR_12540 [Rubrobacteraceae bacterium]
MTEIDNRERGSAAVGRHDPVHRERYRPVRLIGLLLILETVGLVGILGLEFSQVNWWIQVQELPELSRQEVEALTTVLLVPTAVLSFLAALSLLILARRGWLLAAVSQGLGLGVCLWLYSETEPEPVYVYPIMVYCIFIVLYLNSRTVRALFHKRQGQPGKAERP